MQQTASSVVVEIMNSFFKGGELFALSYSPQEGRDADLPKLTTPREWACFTTCPPPLANSCLVLCMRCRIVPSRIRWPFCLLSRHVVLYASRRASRLHLHSLQSMPFRRILMVSLFCTAFLLLALPFLRETAAESLVPPPTVHHLPMMRGGLCNQFAGVVGFLWDAHKLCRSGACTSNRILFVPPRWNRGEPGAKTQPPRDQHHPEFRRVFNWTVLENTLGSLGIPVRQHPPQNANIKVYGWADGFYKYFRLKREDAPLLHALNRAFVPVAGVLQQAGRIRGLLGHQYGCLHARIEVDMKHAHIANQSPPSLQVSFTGCPLGPRPDFSPGSPPPPNEHLRAAYNTPEWSVRTGQ